MLEPTTVMQKSYRVRWLGLGVVAALACAESANAQLAKSWSMKYLGKEISGTTAELEKKREMPFEVGEWKCTFEILGGIGLIQCTNGSGPGVRTGLACYAPTPGLYDTAMLWLETKKGGAKELIDLKCVGA